MQQNGQDSYPSSRSNESTMKRISRYLIGLLLLGCCCANAQSAGTVNLTASPSAGNGVINVTLNWTSSPPATSCALTGGGVTNPTAAPSGTATDTLTKTTTYGIACSWTRTSNTLHWTAPTTNTDGSPLTDLSGYTIWWGLVGNSVSTQTAVTNPAATSFVITPSAPGTYAYTIVACNAAKLCSTPSTSVTGPAIGTTSASATATTTVTPLPTSPTSLTVQ